jgi:AAA family ATP:ADP antiporter
MQKWLESLFGIRRGEAARSLVMFLYGFLLLSAYLILKPVRNSLFLTRFGPEQLVFMYMIIAVVAGGVATAYGLLARRLKLQRLIGFSTLFIVLNLGLFRWLMQYEFSWLVYVFYVWVSLFGVITTSQFWLLANHLFDAREAKRLFPFIGAGAIAGGLAGSKTTNVFAAIVGTENLLIICTGLMLLCFGCLLWVWPLRRGEPAPKRSRQKREPRSLASLLWASRHLRLLAGIIALTVIVSTFIDFQFNTVVAAAFAEKDRLTAFLGDFFFYLSLASLALQFLFSSRILRRFGVGTAILVLPVGLLIGSAALFVWPVLWSAALLKMADGGLRYSVNKAGLELLYLPIPMNIKDRVKALMDVVGDRFARGIGGALLFVVQYLLQWPVRYVALLSGVMIAGWVFLTVRIRREYTHSFRAALEMRTLDSEQIRVQMRDRGSLDLLGRTLASEDPGQIRFALGLTADLEDTHLTEPLLQLLSHADAGIRCEALSQLVRIGRPELTGMIVPLTADPDPDVRGEAIHFLTEHDPKVGRAELVALLENPDPRMQVAGLRCVLAHDLRNELPANMLGQQIEALLDCEDDDSRAARRILASACRYLDAADPEVEYVRRMLDDDDPAVVRGALASAGAIGRREFVPLIIARLADHRLRRAAADALAAYGTRVLGTVRDHLEDDEVPMEIRRTLPRVVSAIGGPPAVALLQANIDTADVHLRHQMLRALNNLRRRDSQLTFDTAICLAQIEREAWGYYLNVVQLAALSGSPDSRALKLLRRAVKERCDLHFEQIFRLAGLIYSADDMLWAYTALVSDSPAQRAGATEFVDNIWSRRLKEILLPLLEAADDRRRVAAGDRLFRLSVRTRAQTLRELIVGKDAWLAACAVYLVQQERPGDFGADIAPLVRHPNQALREAAQAALAQSGARGRET